MKVVIQIPCFNEEATLPATVKALPRALPGVEIVEIMVIDDGSTDRTVEVARDLKVHHIVRQPTNRGLAAAFKAGVDHALSIGADILVNTDGDNQYRGECIADLVQPILKGDAEMVIGARPLKDHPEFSWIKRKLQAVGSAVVRSISGLEVPDATSGFRAFSKAYLLRISQLTNFSYTLETIIQAGRRRSKVVSVPIQINPKTRDSRLFTSMFWFVYNSAISIIRLVIIYDSFKVFRVLSLLLLALGLASAVFAWQGYEEELTTRLAEILVLIAGQVYLIGVVCTLVSANRVLLEELLYQQRLMRQDRKKADP